MSTRDPKRIAYKLSVTLTLVAASTLVLAGVASTTEMVVGGGFEDPVVLLL